MKEIPLFYSVNVWRRHEPAMLDTTLVSTVVSFPDYIKQRKCSSCSDTLV